MVEHFRDRVSNPIVDEGEWDLEKFKQQFDVKISHLNAETANFDLVNIDTSFSNAFRRIMIAEVPTVAIEKVFIEINTSVIQDEVLAQRLGLVPLQMSPDWLDWVDAGREGEVDGDDEDAKYNTRNTVMFSLNVKCERNPHPTGPDDEFINANVYARDLKFEPRGNQLEVMNPPPSMSSPDILLCKLRPGQEISLSCWAVLGVGCDHAKWSPVATAFYRMMPQIDITGDIPPEHAQKFKKCFSPGVVEINEDGRPVIVDARRDTVSREVLRHPEFDGKVKLGRKRDHFVFNVESTGAMEPDEIFIKSVALLRDKAQVLLQCEL